MTVTPKDIKAVLDSLATSKVVCLQAPPRSGKSTYLSLATLKTVTDDNKDGNVIVLEPTFEGAKSTEKYLSRQQKPGLIDIHRKSSTFTPGGNHAKLLIMTPEALVEIYLDLFMTGEIPKQPVASVVIVNDVYIGGPHINLFQYLWYEGMLRGFPSPRLLFTTTVPGHSLFVRGSYKTFSIPMRILPEIVWSSMDSDFASVASDMVSVIKTKHLHNPLCATEKEGWIAFVSSKPEAALLERAINDMESADGTPSSISAAIMPDRLPLREGKRSVMIVTPQYESTVPWNYTDGVFDSMTTNNGTKTMKVSKIVAEHRAAYGKFCRRMITEESFQELPAASNTFGSATDNTSLVSIAINLTEVGVGFTNFMKLNNISEFRIRRITRTISDLGLIVKGNATKRGQYVSYLGLDPFISVCLFELVTSNTKSSLLFPMKYILVAIAVSGLNLFVTKPLKFLHVSDLMVISEAMCNYLNGDMSIEEWCNVNGAKKGVMFTIENRVNEITTRLISLDPTCRNSIQRQAVDFDPEEIVEVMIPTLKDIYKSQLMTSTGTISSETYTSPAGKIYKWTPTFPPEHVRVESAETLIALRTREWTGKEGINRVVTLGHPINDLKQETELDRYLDLLDDIEI